MTGGIGTARGAALCVGAVLGPGVLVLPAMAVRAAGPASLVAWAALLCVSALIATSFATLGARYPDAGGVAAFTQRAFGDRAAAVVGCWLYAAVPAGVVAGAIAGARYTAAAVGASGSVTAAMAVALLAAAYAANLVGLRLSARVQLGLTGVLVGLLVGVVTVAGPPVSLPPGNCWPIWASPSPICRPSPVRACRPSPSTCPTSSRQPGRVPAARMAPTGTAWTAVWGDRPWTPSSPATSRRCSDRSPRPPWSRRNSRRGWHAGEHVIAAARAVYNRAIADGLIDAAASPAHRVVKPRRLPSTRRALIPDELEQINRAAHRSGNDLLLDALLLRLHTETACRRGGALGLRLADLDIDRGLVRLTERGATLRWQPITLDLAAHLDEHARTRGAVLPTDRLLRYRNGQAITSRRYDHLWKRIGERLPWVAAQGIHTHWLRHTTLTWVERHFGYGIARAYAGHTDSTGPATTTTCCAAQRRHDERPSRSQHAGLKRPPAAPGSSRLRCLSKETGRVISAVDRVQPLMRGWQPSDVRMTG